MPPEFVRYAPGMETLDPDLDRLGPWAFNSLRRD